MLTKILYKKSAAKTAGQDKSLSGKVILTKSNLEMVSGARGSGYVPKERGKD
ncbi:MULTISPECIES: hypothetical protein [unclassified Pseudoalteromonas]|uniref:hypothetical protein n=1 Tax=unclassified Pseudoalteromonas TaxID=194690 RepID=UPI0030143D1A